MRHLIIVLGDQLSHGSAALNDADFDVDHVWMAEAEKEATHVWCHKLRLAAFFSAMRHFRDELQAKGISVRYHELAADRSHDRGSTLAEILAEDVSRWKPEKLIAVEPGDWRVRSDLERVAQDAGVPLEWRIDHHFLSTIEEFQEWAEGRKRLTLEDFYRHIRKRHKILLTKDDEPVGGDWNFDDQNRESFSSDGPGKIKAPRSFRTDVLTDKVIDLVNQRFGDHPGTTDTFDVPVNHTEARRLLRDFVKHRLPRFGRYQDAMWTDTPFVYHSRLSFALNLHLISPRECVEAAVSAHEAGDAPINSVEGFVRQIVGWREFIRGVYWKEMPHYLDRNSLRCGDVDVPSFYWDGDCEMTCVRDAMKNVIDHGYAHHIQRLMVLGLLCQLSGVHPRKFHEWHMAMYLDAIDWVSLPNALGMSQYGDGGIVGTKPYCASGNYINKMSNYCRNCRYDHRRSSGEDACPFTTLYWDFLDRHRRQFDSLRRMKLQMKNLERKNEAEMKSIRSRARDLKQRVRNGERF